MPYIYLSSSIYLSFLLRVIVNQSLAHNEYLIKVLIVVIICNIITLNIILSSSESLWDSMYKPLQNACFISSLLEKLWEEPRAQVTGNSSSSYSHRLILVFSCTVKSPRWWECHQDYQVARRKARKSKRKKTKHKKVATCDGEMWENWEEYSWNKEGRNRESSRK